MLTQVPQEPLRAGDKPNTGTDHLRLNLQQLTQGGLHMRAVRGGVGHITGVGELG